MSSLIDIPGLGKKRFDAIAEITEWLKSEKSHYQWINDISAPRNMQQIRNQWRESLSGRWLQSIDQAIKDINNQTSDYLDDKAVDAIQDTFNSRLSNPTPLWSETTLGEFVLSVYEKKGEIAALGALCYLTGLRLDQAFPIDTEFYDGWNSALLYSHGLQKRVPRRYQTIDKLVQEFREQLDECNNNNKSVVEQTELELGKFQRSRESLEERGERQLEVSKKLRERLIAHSKSHVDQLYRTVTEHIAMHQSVEYWERKASNSKDEMNKWRRAYFCSAGIGASVLLLLIIGPIVLVLSRPAEEISYVAERIDVLEGFYILIAGAAAVTVAVWLWVTRVFGRLHLEARAQKEEAEQRVTMIQAYLAMLTDKEAFEKDGAREIILPAIFSMSQPSQTDAGGPPLALDRIMRAFTR